MQVSIDSEQSDPLVTVVGEVDADNCADFGSLLLTAPSEGELVHLDLSGLSFIDSSGISELVRVGDEFSSRGQALKIKNPSDAVRRVLDITGLLEHFGIAD